MIFWILGESIYEVIRSSIGSHFEKCNTISECRPIHGNEY